MNKTELIMKGMIGLEIHTYLITKEKLFCNCKASREKGLQANVNICPICTGQPGAKPMLPNEEAVKQAVRIALLFGCKVSEHMPWKRKHYSWPDLPKGYQNTLSGSHATPVGLNGKFAGINIGSMHLEEDPAAWDPKSGAIDYNRSGLPLVEIVTDPDFTTSEEVVNWLKKLLHAFAYLKAVDGNAGIKVDVNVSIPGKSERVEVKNLNSLESIEKAIKYELERQSKEGGKIKETRRFDDLKNRTEVMRTKEAQDDYRFITDPDLVNLIIDKKEVSKLKESIPELPEDKLDRLISKYKIDAKSADVLAKNLDIVEFFEQIVKKINIELAVPWVTGELLRFLNYNNTTLDKVEIKLEHFIELLESIKIGKITPLKAKEILNGWYSKSSRPEVAGQGKITDLNELKKFAMKVIESNEKAVNDYKNGEIKALDFLMGQLMVATNKRADYKLARHELEKLLK